MQEHASFLQTLPEKIEVEFTFDYRYRFPMLLEIGKVNIPTIFTRSSNLYPWSKNIPEEKVIKREIFTDKLIEAIRASWDEIKSEAEELLRSYDVPPEYADELISIIKRKVKAKLEGLPNEEWLTEILTKLYIRLAYEMLYVR